MDLRTTARLGCDPARVRRELRVLDHYPTWLGIVLGVEHADPGVDDPGPAWWVDLGARLGPFRRAKRVRMARLVDDDDRARFERHEIDGRPHPPWILETRWEAADQDPAESGAAQQEQGPHGGGPAPTQATFLTVWLHYGGTRPLPVLDAVLGREVGRAESRLAARLATGG